MAIKATITYVLAGSTMYTEKECKKLNAFKLDKVFISYKEKGQRFNDILHIRTRTCKPASQTIKITDEAFLWITNEETPLNGLSRHDWKRLTRTQRLQEYCKSTAEDMNAISFEFEIFKD